MKNYIEFVRAKATVKTLTSTDVFTRCIYKALISKEEDKVALAEALLKKAYTPITKPTKLRNGSLPYEALLRDFRMVRFLLNYRDYMKEYLNEEQLETFKAIVNGVKV